MIKIVMRRVKEGYSDDENGRFMGGLRRLNARKRLSMPSPGHVLVVVHRKEKSSANAISVRSHVRFREKPGGHM